MTKEWLKYKDIILEYYQHQSMPLTKVMEVMKDCHNFTASQRAYRQQFQKWGIFKYNRKSRSASQHPTYAPLDHQRPSTAAGYIGRSRSHAHTHAIPSSYRLDYSATPRSTASIPPRQNSLAAIGRNLPYLPYPAQSPHASPGPYMNAYPAYSSSHEAKLPTPSDSPASSYDSHCNPDSKHYHEPDASPYPPIYPQTPLQSHAPEPYPQPPYHNLATSQEGSPDSASTDYMTRFHPQFLDRNASHSQSSHGAGSPPPYDAPPKYHPRETADTPPTAYSILSSPAPSHTHMPGPYLPQIYTPAVSTIC